MATNSTQRPDAERTAGSMHRDCSAARPIGTTGRKYRSVRALIIGEKLPKKVLREFDRLVRLDRKREREQSKPQNALAEPSGKEKHKQP